MARKPAVTHGFVVVDKPAGMTSHDVVGRIRRRFNERRVGHSGTLDPDATGVLLVAVGNATRLLQFFGDLPKTYTGEVVFGSATNTLDASGEVVATSDMSLLTVERVRDASRLFVGEITQVPPMVSALKVDGRRLHEIAREGRFADSAIYPTESFEWPTVAHLDRVIVAHRNHRNVHAVEMSQRCDCRLQWRGVDRGGIVRLAHDEIADGAAPQVAQMGHPTECIAQISRQRAHIRARRTCHFDSHDRITVDTLHFIVHHIAMHDDLPWRTFDFPTLACNLVQSTAIDLECRHHRRNLRDLTHKES
ncbi:MAG: hypothetical protein EBV66_04610 [Actinobacteria bacterium]|nr:hypothetical protein [Actinomycetota bacterium]